MLYIYRTVENELVFEDDFVKGSWVNLINPTDAEIQKVVAGTGISIDLLQYSLDDEEVSRMETDDDQTLIIFNAPIMTKDEVVYDTIPVGIIINDNFIVTICLEDINLYPEFISTRIKAMATFKKTRFILQIFNKKTKLYLKYLRDISLRTNEIEAEQRTALSNKGLFRLLSLQKSLVYFTTALHANAKVLERMQKSKGIKMYEEDEDLLDDVIIENTQAIEMAEIYSNITSNMMNAFASLISNNLNNAMKFLTAVTIILAIPTMFASFWGMNVSVPFQGLAGSLIPFMGICGVAVIICGIIILWLKKKDMF